MEKVIEARNTNSVIYIFRNEIILDLVFGNLFLFIIVYLPEVMKFSWANFIFMQVGFILGVFRYPLLDRKLYRLEFDDTMQTLTCFYYFPFRKKRIIPYCSLSYEYVLERASTYGKKVPTLRFYKNKQLQLRLPEKNRIGWIKEEIDNIIKELDRVIATRDENMLTR